MFVKIRSVEEEFPFYLNEFLEERFPVSWSPEPTPVLDVDDRVSDDNIVLEFLLEMLESKGLLSIAELLKWDSDKEAVLDYLGH